MSVAFTSWPDEFANLYRKQGYWQDKPLTDLLKNKAAKSPAVICGDQVTDYQALDTLSDRLAQHFHNLGLRQGETAIVQLPNVTEFYLVYFALLKIGVAAVNAIFTHNRIELSAYAKQIEPSLVIFSRAHKLFQDEVFIRELEDSFPSIRTVIFDNDEQKERSLEHLLATPADQTDTSFSPSDADQVAFFQLSGGSTGTPKLIPRTHNDYYFSVIRSAEICQLTRDTRYLCALPCAHNYPMSSPGALGVFYAGGAVVMAPSPEAFSCFEIIQKHQVTMAALVPPALALWVQLAEQGREQLTSLQLIQVGGAKLSESLARQVPDTLGCQLQQVLGMAEGLVNYTRLDDPDETIFTTQGRPMCDLDEVKVVDLEGIPVPQGMPGLLVTRGPYTIRGYFNNPEHNAKAFDADGFYYSGDLVRQDSQGYLTVVGRDKDQINRGGEKIAAEEVENLLLTHDNIIHCALVAMPDPMMGEKSCAYLVLKQSDVILKALTLRKFLRLKGIADYKIPDRFECIETLPLTSIGKPDKVALRLMIQSKLSQENNLLGQK
ncbi:(2,3-dihydroxybenzoyl)adenylate synthase [Marinomonas sp.]|uniref:(2,3-dihydroxybenzoyl)adenylate synthase n=1 Tax=Marinomonas sp. TaxID=1904862 RepID=UPI003F96B038